MNLKQWYFTDDQGSFQWDNPAAINELYFPLCNDLGLMSSVTPILHGDIKESQDHFLLNPISVSDLHNSKSARNFWFYIEGKGPWSVTGNSALAHTKRFDDSAQTNRTVEAGLLWHKVTYVDSETNLKSQVLSFVPLNHKVELMVVTLTNISTDTLQVTPTSSIPIFGRSAENQRDHRHVTSLVNRPLVTPQGLTMQPVIKFDETGHKYNHTLYYVFGSEANGTLPLGTIGSTDDFIGLQGDLEWPEAVVTNAQLSNYEDQHLEGKECIGALRFATKALAPSASITYILQIGISDDTSDLTELFSHYDTLDKVNAALELSKQHWITHSTKASFTSGLNGFSNWIKWVEVQPVFRKIYGCSFLPYHDYGKGGRGWRDLWQDCLSLILLQPDEAKELLINNFGGVRMDGTNATIIGTKPGEFIADRNNIPRVWMDHGSWPFLTTKLYIDQSGDIDLLLHKQTYFKDQQMKRASVKDENWTSDHGNQQKTKSDDIYEGTLLEHILLQHMTTFYNVGEHNIMKLEGADWNDTLDMARTRGESTAFTALYGSNLISIAQLLKTLKEKGHSTVEVFEEFSTLLQLDDPSVYDDIVKKHDILDGYFNQVQPSLKGKMIDLSTDDLINDLEAKGQWVYNHLRTQEFITTTEDDGFFNGYYNNDGESVDGEFPEGIRMDLTGQVFTTMFGLATDEQVLSSYAACQKFLKDPATGGYKLNTPLGPNTLNFGRGFSFAYGEKENGATFSHMVTMYMNALYQRGFVTEAYEIFTSIYDLCMDNPNSTIYPGIPEYFNLAGKGMYSYLTGSASWLFLTVLTEMYGVKGHLGHLCLQPNLTKAQFNVEGFATVTTTFADHQTTVTYSNPQHLEHKDYSIQSVILNGLAIEPMVKEAKKIIISREHIQCLPQLDDVQITVVLG